ncbi:hypothetical protein TD95_002912 [Thielaviopsis punctulata]|uniref:Kinesin motor domain-containing protein n=1 Tax=Thielaviopsis punctulata TaxID=72032 RepID=A0A0F4ZD86_9PEZI|nr:hypothetical protein TD95_002912 [Thielaviopsis punctulata]
MPLPDPAASSITVAVRVRPFTVREAAQINRQEESTLFLGDGSLAGVSTPKLNSRGLRSVIKVIDDRCLVFDPPEDNPVQKFSRTVVPNGKKTKDQVFAFDRIFDDHATQTDVYEATTKQLLDSVMDGYNATVFAYGATGCGKTHTITGTPQSPGIIFLTMQELFEKIEETSQEKVTEISLSYLEIYNETIRDLLVPGGGINAPKGGLMLREDSNQAVTVAGLTSYHPKNVQEVMDMIVRGNEFRTVSPTMANAVSSRSHAVLQINVAMKDRNAAVSEPHTMATLSIIDLAGSERASATQNRGERLIEGANINKSLLALGSCINALCDPQKHNHVPYRNSKLTRLLKFSLGGNCKTVMIVCVSPSSAHYDETQNTLRYANRAKNIQTKVTRNVFNVNRHVKDFLVKIDEQIALINELKAQQKDAERTFYAKFRKQAEKRDASCKEGLLRIRAAYENAANERLEKITNMRRLKAFERRISLLGAWIHAFESAAAAHLNNADDERPSIPESLSAVRKTAEGIMVELENSRHVLLQKVEKSNWDRAMETALSHSIKQLPVDKNSDGSEVARLRKEVDMLKMDFEAQMYRQVVEQEKLGDAALMQVLLAAQLEMLMALNDTMGMSEEAAVAKAKQIINRLLEAGHKAVSHVVKPDGSLGASAFDASGGLSHAHSHFGLTKRGPSFGGAGGGSGGKLGFGYGGAGSAASSLSAAARGRRKSGRESFGFGGASISGVRNPGARSNFGRASLGPGAVSRTSFGGGGLAGGGVSLYQSSQVSKGQASGGGVSLYQDSFSNKGYSSSSNAYQSQVNGVSNHQNQAGADFDSTAAVSDASASAISNHSGFSGQSVPVSSADAHQQVTFTGPGASSGFGFAYAEANSPLKTTPRRRTAGLGTRVNVSFTPVKRLSMARPSSQASKRNVRWRDDDDEGTLADFANTPPRFSLSPMTTPEGQQQQQQHMIATGSPHSSKLSSSFTPDVDTDGDMDAVATNENINDDNDKNEDDDLDKPMPPAPMLPSYLQESLDGNSKDNKNPKSDNDNQNDSSFMDEANTSVMSDISMTAAPPVTVPPSSLPSPVSAGGAGASIPRPSSSNRSRFAAGFLSRGSRLSLSGGSMSGIPVSGAGAGSSPDALRTMYNGSPVTHGNGSIGSPSSIPRVASPRNYVGSGPLASKAFGGGDENRPPLPSSLSRSNTPIQTHFQSQSQAQTQTHSASPSSSSFGEKTSFAVAAAAPRGSRFDSFRNTVVASGQQGCADPSEDLEMSQDDDIPCLEEPDPNPELKPEPKPEPEARITANPQARKAERAGLRRASIGSRNWRPPVATSNAASTTSTAPKLVSISEDSTMTVDIDVGSVRKSLSLGSTSSSRRRSSIGIRQAPRAVSPPPLQAATQALSSGQERRMNLKSGSGPGSPGRRKNTGSLRRSLGDGKKVGGVGESKKVTVTGLAGQPQGQPVPKPAESSGSGTIGRTRRDIGRRTSLRF